MPGRSGSFHCKQITIVKPDGGKLRGQLWWPSELKNTLKRGESAASTEGSSSRTINSEKIQRDYSKYYAGDNPVVVFVHQYSLMGGSSSLLSGMAMRVARGGVPALTFDLRGVNSSSGWRTLTGHKETQDVVTACSWCVENLHAKNIFIVGSSAGAPIGGSAIDQLPEIRGFVGIGYVFGAFASILFGGHYKHILKSKKPKLFIHGDEDGFTSTATFKSYFNTAEGPKEMRIVPKAGHFEMEGPAYDPYMAEQILNFINLYGTPPEDGGTRENAAVDEGEKAEGDSN